VIETSALFRDLPAPLLAEIKRLCLRRRLETDQVLFRKGDAGDALYGVLSGRLRIHAVAADGRDALLNIMQPGDLFGEIAMIDGLERTAEATAIEPSEIVMLRRSDFLDLMRRESELGLHLLQLMCLRLRWLSDRVEDATFLPAPARLAKRLLHLARTQGRDCPEGVLIDWRLPQRVLGELAGVSRETTNKTLRAWSQQGWIVLRRETVVVRDLDALQEIAESETAPAV
jgi:CRP/FNR family cyclic AMP-dependent transcriptional regulator